MTCSLLHFPCPCACRRCKQSALILSQWPFALTPSQLRAFLLGLKSFLVTCISIFIASVLFVASLIDSLSLYKVGDCILPRVGTILGSTGPPIQHPLTSWDRTFNDVSHYSWTVSATVPPLWSTGFSLQIHCPAILILYLMFNQMRPAQMVMDITFLPQLQGSSICPQALGRISM